MDTRYSVAGIAGWGTTIALIVSLMNALTPGRSPQSPPAAAPPRAQSAKPRSVAQRGDPHVVVTGRQLLDAFLGDTANPAKKSASPYELGVLYVSVPDPIDSHLDWAYDAQVNATRRALERDNYVIDRFWVPWNANHDSASVNGQSELMTVHSHHPGVVLFRKTTPGDRRLRLVYVVGEIPTTGIHKAALIRALSEGESLLRNDPRFVRDASMGQEVRIVGPAFSGSAPSLRQGIDQWRADTAVGKRDVRVITGSASNGQNPGILSGDGVTFTATVYDDNSLSRFEKLLLNERLGIPPERTALLRETSTQYGQLSDQASSGADTITHGQAIQIPFPMHISELREEYARNPDQLIIGHDIPGERRNVRLPVKLGEGARLADGPPVVSDLTPPAVDAMLDDIARSLTAHDIKAAGILATDARDVIFLGTELRKRVHDVLLFTYGSNVLYARPDVSQWLRGMLVISTYPVTVESQFWDVTQRYRQRISFSGDMAEGMYNAVLMQLGDSASARLADYSSPLSLSKNTRPEIWVTTVGTNSMLPVTLLQNTDADSGRGTGSYIASHERADTSAGDATALLETQEGTNSKSDPGFLIILVAIGFAWLLRDQLDLRRNVRPRRDEATRLLRPADVSRHLTALRDSVASGWRADWLAKNRIAQTCWLLLQHEMYTALRAVSLMLAFIATLFLLLRLRSHASGSQLGVEVGVGISLLAGLFVVARALWFVVTIGRAAIKPVLSYCSPRGWPNRKSWGMWLIEALGRSATFVFGGVALAVILLLAYDVATLSEVHERLFFFRSTAVTGGVSPGIPLLIAGALFYTWCIWNCKRVALLLRSTPFEQLYFDKFERRSPGNRSDDSPALAIGWRPDAVDGGPPVNTPVNVSAIMRRDGGGAAAAGGEQGGGVAVATKRSSAVAHGLDSENLSPRPSTETAVTETAVTETATQVDVRQTPKRRDRRKGESILEDSELAAHVRQVRVRLALSVPGVEGLVAFLALAFLLIWGWNQFNRTIDSLVLSPSILAGSRHLTNFDLLLRVGSLGAIGATLFGAFRLVTTWIALREALRDLGEAPLLYAFDGLPLPVARLTRLGIGHQPSDPVIAGALQRGWLTLDRLHSSSLVSTMPASVLTLRGSTASEPPDGAEVDAKWPTFSSWSKLLLDRRLDSRLRRLLAALHAAWIAWPAALDGVAADVWDAKESSENAELRRNSARALAGQAASEASAVQRTQETWLLVAGECAAVYAVEYIEWVMHHLRSLAAFLVTALVLTNALLASYPFQPQSALKAVFLGVTVVTVGALVYALLQMNRNDVLSLITKTDPGRVNWTGPFVLKLALTILVPLGALLSTEFPFIREFLFSWVGPSLRALGKA